MQGGVGYSLPRGSVRLLFKRVTYTQIVFFCSVLLTYFFFHLSLFHSTLSGQEDLLR